MRKDTPKLTEQEAAGLRLLSFKLKNDAEFVAKRWRNPETQTYCHAIALVAAALRKYADGGEQIDIQVLVQTNFFDYSLTDEGYALIK